MPKMTISLSMAVTPPIECRGIGSYSGGAKPRRFEAHRVDARATGDDAFGTEPVITIGFSGYNGKRWVGHFTSTDEALADVRHLVTERLKTAFSYATTVQEG